MLDIVIKPCKQNKDRIVWVMTVKLGTHTCYGKKVTPIDVQYQVSEVKITR